MKMYKLRVFKTTGMLYPPRWLDDFRVAQHVGCCILRLPGVAVMRCY